MSLHSAKTPTSLGQAPKVAVESVVGGVRDCGAGRAPEATVPAGGTCPPVLLAGHACQCYWWSPGLLVIYSKGDDATGSATVRWVASVPGAADSAAKSRPRIKVRDVTAARAAVATACLAAAVRPNRTPLPLGPPIPAAIAWACAASGVAASRWLTVFRRCAVKIAPSAAMPVAVPTWRNVELIPEAMPARAGATTPTAVEASGTLTSPDPAPATISPGMRWVQPEPAVRPRISSSPAATSTNPAEIVSRTGMTAVSRPAAPAVTKVARVSSSRRTPVPNAENPSPSCRYNTM